MVTILPKHDPFGGLIKGLGEASDAFSKYQNQKKENEALKKLGIDVGGIPPGPTRQKYIDNQIQKKLLEQQSVRDNAKIEQQKVANIERDTAKIAAQEASKDREMTRLSKFLEGDQNTEKISPIDQLDQASQDEMDQTTQEESVESKWEKMSPNQKALVAQRFPHVAAQLQKDQELKARSSQAGKKFSQQERQYAHSQTADYAKDLEQKSTQAHGLLDAVNEVKRVAKKGVTGLSGRNIALEYLKKKESPFANLFQSEDTQALATSAKTLAGGGFKELFSSKGTQREFFWFENILPNILKNGGTNIKSTEYIEKMAKYNIRKQEIADKIVKKNGGYRPIDLDRQVREKIKPELDNLVTEGEKLYLQQNAPDPKVNEGRTIKDENGQKYKSNGTTWEPI